jgi:hypothetical protein
VEYACPLIVSGVPSTQLFETVVGATSPRNVIEVREEQDKNAKLPMYVTLLGMVTEVRASHWKNAN